VLLTPKITFLPFCIVTLQTAFVCSYACVSVGVGADCIAFSVAGTRRIEIIAAIGVIPTIILIIVVFIVVVIVIIIVIVIFIIVVFIVVVIIIIVVVVVVFEFV
jgi:hypothetical protein